MDIGRRLTLGTLAMVALLLFLLPATVSVPAALGAPEDPDGWSSDPSFTLNFLGRDGPGGTDRYRVTLAYGASFFGVAVESMPLVAPEQSVAFLQDGYRATFPGRPLEDIQPGDSFDFFVPSGTLVCAQWRQRGSAREFKSLRGDYLVIYTNPRSPIVYRLMPTESPKLAEIAINLEIDLEPGTLARGMYGQDDPNFKPDFLQLTRAKGLIKDEIAVVTVDLTRAHLDDLQEIKAGGEPGGKTEDDLDVYWFRSGEQAQPLFRVEDALGDRTDPTGLPSLIRVYYYKDGVVRSYQRTSDTLFLSGRQPRNDLWAKVYADYGLVNPAPTRWEIGQPEQDDQAKELGKLGITVLRFQPKEAPKGNFFTHLLDLLLGMMKRKES